MLSETKRRALQELRAACDERIRYGGEGWVGTAALCGPKLIRSARMMRSLVALGLAEGVKPEGAAQQQWRWRITDQGRAALKEGGADAAG